MRALVNQHNSFHISIIFSSYSYSYVIILTKLNVIWKIVSSYLYFFCFLSSFYKKLYYIFNILLCVPYPFNIAQVRLCMLHSLHCSSPCVQICKDSSFSWVCLYSVLNGSPNLSTASLRWGCRYS